MRSHRTAALRKGGLVLAPLALAILAAQGVVAAPGTLNYKQVPQFVNILPNPLAPTFIWQPDSGSTDTYTLKIQEFLQPLGLGAAVPPTLVWGYGKDGQPGTPRAKL